MKKTLGWIFTLWGFIVGAVLVIAKLLGTTGIDIHLIEWIFSRALLLSPGLFPLGIVLLCKGSKVGEYISYGWTLAKKNIKQYWLPLIVILLIEGTITVTSQVYGTVILPNGTEDLNTLGMTLLGINYIISILFAIGLIKLGLQAGDEQKKFSIKTLFVHKWSEIWKSIVSPLLYGIIMFIPGLIMVGLIVFGILGTGTNLKLDNFPAQAFKDISTQSITIGIITMILGLVLMFYLVYVHLRITPVLKYTIIDHNNLGPWAMIKRSWKISKGKVWRLFSVGFVAGLINILGIFTLGIGLLWTIPLTLIAQAKLYKDLDKDYDEKEVK